MASITERDVITSTAVNDRDQGAILTVALAFCTCCSFIFLFVRLAIRQPLKSLFGRDDAATVLATSVGLVQSMLTLRAVSQGLGRRDEDLSENRITGVNKLIFAADLLYIAAVYSAKIAVVFFFMRLSSNKEHRVYCYILAAACAAFSVVSALLLSLQPPIRNPWITVISPLRLSRWIATETMSGLIDLAIAGFPVLLVKELVMRRWVKIRIVCSIAIRLILIPLAIAQLVTWPSSVPSHFDYIPTELYMQAQMCYNIISATIPCLSVFLQGASPNFLGGENYIDSTSTALAVAGGSGRSGTAYKFSNLSHRKKRADDDSVRLTRRDYGETLAYAARAGDRADRSVESDSSERAIVVQHTVNVRYSGER